jgi:N-acetyl-anhydromuramyl-L-alanine amidase AmpD
MTVLDKITTVPFEEKNYVNETTTKNQIYIHHTASSANPYGVIEWWKQTPERVATAFVIGGRSKSSKWKDGEILQCFGSGKWGWHLGLTAQHLKAGGPNHKSSTDLNKLSIGIEICSWGQLTKTDKGFKSYAGEIVPDDEVVEFSTPYKGFKYYHKYSDAQIQNTGELLTYLCDKWSIPKDFKGMQMFDIDARCLQGESGIWTHTSCRPDKFDCFPQPELIQMLQTL